MPLLRREDAIDTWKERVLDHEVEIDPGDEHDWDSLAIGFFLGLDFSLEQCKEILDELTNKGLI